MDRATRGQKKEEAYYVYKFSHIKLIPGHTESTLYDVSDDQSALSSKLSSNITPAKAVEAIKIKTTIKRLFIINIHFIKPTKAIGIITNRSIGVSPPCGYC